MRTSVKSSKFTILLVTSLILTGCENSEVKDGGPNVPTVQTQPTTLIVQNETPARREPSLVSLSAGAFPVKKPQEYSSAYSTIDLLDERPKTNWSTPRGVIEPQVLILALPEKTLLKKLEFDCGSVSSAYQGSCAKDITIEMSDASEADGFQKIADVSLAEGKDNQIFPVLAEIPGRWVRLTIKNNHGNKDFIQLNDFRATGTQLTHTPFPNVSGTYESDLGDLHIKQEGASVSGCYYTRQGAFDGGIEGRITKLSWCEYCGDTKEKASGSAFIVFSPDGQQFIGGWWSEKNTADNLYKSFGKKKSSDVGKCPGWAGSIEEQITKDLAQDGKARLYGVNFDTDSDKIKDESKPTLDKIINILKKNADWKLEIEGHTDSTATSEHNQKLSERRADAVKNYLQAGGIDASRLTTAGYGDTKPLASNETELGRAQNRRVELIRQ